MSQRDLHKLEILEGQKASWEYVLPYVEKAFGQNSYDYKQSMLQLMEIRKDISDLKEKMMTRRNKGKKKK